MNLTDSHNACWVVCIFKEHISGILCSIAVVFPSPMLAITHPISPAHRWTLFSRTCCTSSFIVISPRVSSSSWMFQQMVCVQNLAQSVRQVTSGFQRGAYLYDSTIPRLLFFFFSHPSLSSLTFSPVFSEIRNYPLFRQVVVISKDSLCSKEKQQQNLHINLHSPTCHVFFFSCDFQFYIGKYCVQQKPKERHRRTRYLSFSWSIIVCTIN